MIQEDSNDFFRENISRTTKYLFHNYFTWTTKSWMSLFSPVILVLNTTNGSCPGRDRDDEAHGGHMTHKIRSIVSDQLIHLCLDLLSLSVGTNMLLRGK